MMPATIMLVADNPATRKLVRFTLEQRGHRVLEAPDGKSALALLESQSFSLVLQDLVLPDIDGFTLVEELRRRCGGERLPILAFSGFISRLEEARISAVGFDDVITKPIEPSRLVRIVEAHLSAGTPVTAAFGAGRRLLLVDDDPIELKLTRFRLRRLGFEVDAVSTADAALLAAEEAPPDIVVSDALMPGVDGFALAQAFRRNPALRHVPIVLLTASQAEPSDRELAHEAGATDLVARTPELEALTQLLEKLLATASEIPPPPKAAPVDVDAQRTRRTVRELERQLSQSSGLGRRCSSLAAELTVLTGISEMVLHHRDIETTLDDTLAACLDAGGVSVGALYLLSRGELRVRPLGGASGARSAELQTFFGHEALLRRIVSSGQIAELAAPDFTDDEAREVLQRAGADSLLVVPILHAGQALGALLTLGNRRHAKQGEWRLFLQGVANQIAQTLALARAFSEREAAEQAALEQRRIADERAALLRSVLEEIGALAQRLGLTGVARVQEHVRALSREGGAAPGTDALRELLAPFEAMFRGYGEANEGLARLNAQLAQRNRELLEANAAAASLNAELEAFSYSVSHDLRAPLRAIQGFSRALDEDCGAALDATARLHVARIRASAQRMGQLIDDLLHLSRLSTTALHERSVDLSQLARSVEQQLRAAHPERRVTFHVEEGLTARGDERLLTIVLENLLGNAWKFTSKVSDAVVSFGCRERDGARVFFLQDNGAGFDMQHAGKMFGAFQRLHSSQEFEGTGVGLATVRRIVHRHGGEIWATGSPGGGATFHFTLGHHPVHGSPDAPPPASRPAPPSPC